MIMRMACGTNRWIFVVSSACLTACSAGSGESAGQELTDGTCGGTCGDSDVDDVDDGNDDIDTGNNTSDATGGAEETSFGMGDDVPLATSIPAIKQGEVDLATRVRLPEVVMTSPEGTIDATRAFFVQEDQQLEYAGLRVLLPQSFAMPSGGARLDLVGLVYQDEGLGWSLAIEDITEGDSAAPPEPIPVGLAEIAARGSEREALADMVVHVEDPEGDTLWISDVGTDDFEVSGEITVDLLPFGVAFDPPDVGAPIESITGVLFLVGERTLLLPRSGEEIVS